jgi:hypothetical protein
MWRLKAVRWGKEFLRRMIPREVCVIVHAGEAMTTVAAGWGASVLALPRFVLIHTGANFNPRSFIVRTEERKRIPPIDLEVPVAVQTATFGLG